MDRIARFVTTRGRIVIAVVALANIASLLSFFRFSLDTEFVNFFAADNPELAAYKEINEKYDTGEAVTVLVESDGSLLSQENLLEVFELQAEISPVTDVRQVQSYIPTTLPSTNPQVPPVPVTAALITQNSPALAEFIDQRYFLTPQFLAEDRRSAIIVVGLEAGADSGPVVDSLREIIADYPDLNPSLAGNPVIKSTIVSYLVTILFILLPFAVLLILAVFYFILRHRRLTPLAMLPAAFGSLWTFGSIFFSGNELSLVTVISPIFIVVIGSAYGLHYVSHFQEKLAESGDSVTATRETLRMVGTPIVLATVTTMAGFISLTWADAIPMRQMGLFVTLGIGYAGLLAIFFLPAVLSHIKVAVKPPPAGSKRIGQLIGRASTHRLPIVLGVIAIIAAAAVFIPRLEVVSDQLMFFKASSEIRQTSASIEEHFGSAQPLVGELVSDQGRDALFDAAEAEKLLAVERQLEDRAGVRSATSVFDLVAGFSRMTTGATGYPLNPAMVQAFLAQLGEDGVKSWVADDGFRMMIRPVGLGADEIDGLLAFASTQPEIKVITGMPVLFDEFNRIVVQSQLSSLGLALGLVFLMLLLTLRSFKAAIVGLMPIILTIGAIMAFLVISGFNLNILTATLSAIVIGVGVDYSIHLISGIYYYRKAGRDDAVDAALESVSRPVLANAYGLSIGLSVLFFSPLLIHAQAAAVMWVAMVISSAAALLIIPQFYRSRPKIR